MPIYEYQCQACEAVHEALQKISDPILKKCPECGKLKLKKLVSAPSFRLSGTGWYETDFKTDNDKKRNLATDDSKSDSKKESSSKDSQSKDSKADKKSEGKKTPSDKTSQKTTTKSKKKKA